MLQHSQIDHITDTEIRRKGILGSYPKLLSQSPLTKKIKYQLISIICCLLNAIIVHMCVSQQNQMKKRKEHLQQQTIN